MATTQEAVLATLYDEGRGYRIDEVVREVVQRVGECQYDLSIGHEALAAAMSSTGVADDFWNMTCGAALSYPKDRLIFGPRHSGTSGDYFRDAPTTCTGIVGYIDDSGQKVMY